jgi:hypothetical protein
VVIVQLFLDILENVKECPYCDSDNIKYIECDEWFDKLNQSLMKRIIQKLKEIERHLKKIC